MPRPKPPTLQLAQALGHDAADKRLEILRRVGESGSISQAARAAGVSYKAAWQALDTLSNLAGLPLVERAVGGAGGGGARLAPAGAQLLQAAQELDAARRLALARLAGQGAGLAALALRTSMRNQLPCTVAQVVVQGPLARVLLSPHGGGGLAARITAESVQLLGLRQGQDVIALCKATAVRVLPAASAEGGSQAANLMDAKASRVARGAAGDEVSARLDASGLQLVGFAPAGCRLRAGSRVRLAVDESAMVIALPT